MGIANRYMSPVYRMARGIVWLFFRLAFRFRIVNRDLVPKTGPLVLGSNHIHNLDPLTIGLGTPRFVHFMAKIELFKYRWFAALIRYFGAFPVRRGAGDKQAIRMALEIPEHDGCLLIFPEGHRSKDGRLQRGLPGVAFIARKARCPIVPVAICGGYRFRGRLTIRYGEPFVPSEEDTNEMILETLMGKIQALLNEGHPK
ncbi:1-acyl-sn-glycerol-3-phosphate acyltransferase [Alicyclobacillus contaminans]|uniref:lysophospholipid acyltransferase family protein n=1 Tax=Alicyclobacillus contaminans TaxID=392016 RepID=UPI0004254C7B|nr:lysophospholipid acyltransferase family protein [Alicyclobacillus contaminans]GMA52514.1 1-acyl-sn-glycerol-3-phosphate acyltransferase [Alicyclobacillus contaminans]